MRFIFLLGGFCGFALAGGASWLAENLPGRVFFDASSGCLVGALLFRWLWTVVLNGLRQTITLRHEAALAEAAKTARSK